MEQLPDWLVLGIGAGGLVILKGFLNLLIKVFGTKFGVKDKDGDAINNIRSNCSAIHQKTDERIERLEESNTLQLKTNLAILLALKRGKVNGECDEALEGLNNYLCERK